jgi:hypothetical protein
MPAPSKPNLSTAQARAKRAVRNARTKWPHATAEDAEEIEADLVLRLLNESPDDPVAWGTLFASRAFSARHRRATVEAKHASRASAALARKASDESAARGRPRSRRYDKLAEVKAAVRRECEDEFFGFAHQKWDGKLQNLIMPHDDPYAGEREARRLFRALRTAMRECSAFVHYRRTGGPPFAGNTSQYLGWWVPQFIDPLLKHAAIEHEPDDRDFLDPLARFVSTWDSLDLLQLGSGTGRATGFLSDRELAVVSLLGGFFPQSIERDATTAGKLTHPIATGTVLEAQKAAVRTARRRHGRLKDAISKALQGVAPMPKEVRYVVQGCETRNGKRIPVGAAKPFPTLEAANKHSMKRWPGSAAAEMERDRSWWVWVYQPDQVLVATIELRDLSQNHRRSPAVPE